MIKLDKNWNKKKEFNNHVKKLNPYFSSEKRENFHLLIKINEHKVDVLIDMGAFMFVILINTIRELGLKGENMQNYI